MRLLTSTYKTCYQLLSEISDTYSETFKYFKLSWFQLQIPDCSCPVVLPVAQQLFIVRKLLCKRCAGYTWVTE